MTLRRAISLLVLCGAVMGECGATFFDGTISGSITTVQNVPGLSVGDSVSGWYWYEHTSIDGYIGNDFGNADLFLDLGAGYSMRVGHGSDLTWMFFGIQGGQISGVLLSTSTPDPYMGLSETWFDWHWFALPPQPPQHPNWYDIKITGTLSFTNPVARSVPEADETRALLLLAATLFFAAGCHVRLCARAEARMKCVPGRAR